MWSEFGSDMFEKKSMKNPFTIFPPHSKLFTIMWFICLCDEICTILKASRTCSSIPFINT